MTHKTRPALLLAAITSLMVACSSGPRISVTQTLEEHVSDAPYSKILVVTLFDSFDARRYLEEEIVNHLAEHGVVGVPSTSMMDTRTPVAASTFIEMVDKIDADAVLLTQLSSHHVDQSAKDSSPRATYNYWPTYYYNVFEVELTEYVEPQRLQLEHDLVLVSQVFSVESREPVWAIESRSQFVVKQEDGLDYKIFVNEAAAIVKNMTQHELVAR